MRHSRVQYQPPARNAAAETATVIRAAGAVPTTAISATAVATTAISFSAITIGAATRLHAT